MNMIMGENGLSAYNITKYTLCYIYIIIITYFIFFIHFIVIRRYLRD